MKRIRHDLGNFCQPFDLSIKKPICSGTYSKPQLKPPKPLHKWYAHEYRKHSYTKYELYYKIPHKKSTKNS
jgi:hypothetical protein